MNTSKSQKSTVEEIRNRFDHDVERFSNLDTGQTSTMDASLALDLVTQSAAALCPSASASLDIGCGAGNFTLKLLQRLPNLDVTLIDLSRPMLDRAVERIQPRTGGQIRALQADIREAELPEQGYDVILAAAVFHHLRSEAEWKAVFAKCHRSLKPGGSLWIFDMVDHENPLVHALMWARYAAYLEGLKGSEYRDSVFAYIEKEDTPRSLTYQLNLLQRTGFRNVEVLHKNGPFAAFGGMK